MRTFLSIASLLLTGAVHAATCVTDLSLNVTGKAPTGDLVYLRLSEGFDPFKFFKAGLDLARENPLVISNAKHLDVFVGGKGFKDGEVEGKYKFGVKSLTFDQAAARFLITAKVGRVIVYEILVNVDRPEKAAHVYMRVRTADRRRSDWALAATYGNVAPTHPRSDVGRGLMGQDESGKFRLLTVGRTPEELTLDLHDGSALDSPVRTRIVIDERIRHAVADGDLAALGGVSFGDDDGRDVRFRYEDGRLGVRIHDQGRRVNLSHVVAWRRR